MRYPVSHPFFRLLDTLDTIFSFPLPFYSVKVYYNDANGGTGSGCRDRGGDGGDGDGDDRFSIPHEGCKVCDTIDEM